MGVQSVTLGRGRAHPLAWRCSCRLKGRLLGGCGRLGRLGRLGIQHSQEEEEAARLGEHRAGPVRPRHSRTRTVNERKSVCLRTAFANFW